MADPCGHVQSPMLMALDPGLILIAGASVEFCRGAKAYTPAKAMWAGDILITTQAEHRQSFWKRVNGGACDVKDTVSPSEDCKNLDLSPAGIINPEETDVRNCSLGFSFDPERSAKNGWDMDIYASVEDCGVLVDGGDIYYNGEWTTKFKSLDDTFSHTTAGPDELINIAYLDNRKTYSKDPDKGLLFAIQDILSKAWLFKFTHKDGQTIGKMEDVTSIIAAKLAEKELGMQDVLLVGMI